MKSQSYPYPLSGMNLETQNEVHQDRTRQKDILTNNVLRKDALLQHPWHTAPPEA